MSSDHKIKLVEVVSLMSGVVEKTLLSETQFLRTIYTLLLDKTCSNKHKIDLINVMKVRYMSFCKKWSDYVRSDQFPILTLMRKLRNSFDSVDSASSTETLY